MPEFSSSDVVAYILYKVSQENHRISLTQTQKLLYCCYGIVMAKFNERLTDEHPKCWPFGPVFLNTLNDIDNHNIKVKGAVQFIAECPKEWLEWIDRTIKAFWDYSDKALVKWSIRPETPWFNADPLASLDDREIGIWFKQFGEIIWNAK